MMQLTLVTAASHNHFLCLRNLLHTARVFEPRTRCIVYDLGLLQAEQELLKNQPNVFLRKFTFEDYPAWMRLRATKEKGRRCGFYAWKPVIIHEVFHEFGDLVLWMDAGNLLKAPLDAIRRVLTAHSVYSPISAGDIGRWTHPATLRRMHVPNSQLSCRNRNAALVGLNAARLSARVLATMWKDYALQREYIAPIGATILNHRYDQALLSVLLYRLQERYGYALVNAFLDVSHHNDHCSMKTLIAHLSHNVPDRSLSVHKACAATHPSTLFRRTFHS